MANIHNQNETPAWEQPGTRPLKYLESIIWEAQILNTALN